MESNDTPDPGFDAVATIVVPPTEARIAALDVIARLERAGFDPFEVAPVYRPMVVEMLDLAFEAHAAKGIASMYATMGVDDGDLPPDGDDGEPHQVGVGGETLAGRLDVTDKGLRFRAG